MTSNAATAPAELSDQLAAAIARAGASTVTVHARRRIPASGVIWSDGLIVTADHAVEREEAVTVGMPDDSEIAVEVAGRDPRTDLAVLRAALPDATTAERAPAEAPTVGQIALAVARPGGGGVQASMGIVSAIGAVDRSRRGGARRGSRRRGQSLEGFVLSDTTFFPGFSGGPLVDMEGRVLGINSSRFRPQPGLTIPSSLVANVVDVLARKGRITRAYLGIGSQVVRLPASMSEALGGQETGLLIHSVEEETPAAAAGLLVGDILVSLEGEQMRDAEDLQSGLAPERVGESVRLTVLRGGAQTERSATLAERQ